MARDKTTIDETMRLKRQLDKLYDSLPELPEDVMATIHAIVDTEIQLESYCNQ